MKMDSYAELALRGEPLRKVTVVDAHMHSTRTAHFFSRFDDGADMLAQMERIGVDIGFLSDLWSVDEQWDSFEKLSEFCGKAPGRFYAYSSPHPDWEDFGDSLFRQCESPLVVGIKLHPVLHKKPFDCMQYRTAYECGAEYGLPVLIHTWGTEDIKVLAALADQYPETSFLAGHSGGEAPAVHLAAKEAAKRENMYLDTACSFVWQGAIEYMTNTAGADKILYGSDAYWNSMEAAVGRVLMAEISEEEKDLILGKNALRIFKRVSGE